MEEDELTSLEHGLRGIFSEYESTLKKYGIPKRARYELAKNILRKFFYCGATNQLDDFPLKYKDFESKEEEEAKIDKKINSFEKILKEYVKS